MWKLVFNLADVIFKFESPKRKTHLVQKNNSPSNFVLKYTFVIEKFKKKKLQFIWTYENMVKF